LQGSICGTQEDRRVNTSSETTENTACMDTLKINRLNVVNTEVRMFVTKVLCLNAIEI
jgi:hypothetical protein